MLFKERCLVRKKHKRKEGFAYLFSNLKTYSPMVIADYNDNGKGSQDVDEYKYDKVTYMNSISMYDYIE